MQALQQRLAKSDHAASEASQQLAVCRADADAATAAAGIARGDADGLRAELRLQRDAAAQVCVCLRCPGCVGREYLIPFVHSLCRMVLQAQAELHKAQLALQSQGNQTAAAHVALDAAHERHAHQLVRQAPCKHMMQQSRSCHEAAVEIHSDRACAGNVPDARR
jgi:hypothetical protein